MLQAILITQGRLAHELLNSAERILGQPLHARCVCLDWEASAEQDRQVLAAALSEYSAADCFLLLTDMPGSTPHRVASDLANERMEVVTGVNLAMVVRLGCLPEVEPRSIHEIASWIVEKGRKAVVAGGCRVARDQGECS